MSGLIEAASAILRVSERRLAGVSMNVANLSTAGYKKRVSFADLAAAGPGVSGLPTVRLRSDMAAGKLSDTGNPLDLAIGGDGFFQVRDGDDMLFTRSGAFRLAEDGRVLTAQGFALQQAGGGDLMLDRSAVEIRADGQVLDGDRQVGRIGVFAAPTGETGAGIEPLDGSMFRFTGEPAEVAAPGLRQGMIEASNVSIGDEMITMMAALRQAESGARLVQTYDDLLGRAITAFGQAR